MSSVSLHDLIAALSGAVVQAQDAIEEHQLDLLSRHFDASGRPISLEIMLPNTNATTGENYQILSVPRLSLVEANFLRISEFTVEFNVELGDLGQSLQVAQGTATLDTASPGDAAPPVDGEKAASAAGPQPSSTQPSSTPPQPAAAAQFFGWRLSRPFRRGAPTGVPKIGPPAIVPADTPSTEDGQSAPSPAPALDQGAPEVTDAASPNLSVGVSPKMTNSPTAKATIKVSAQPLSEGMVRLLNHLNKTI